MHHVTLYFLEHTVLVVPVTDFSTDLLVNLQIIKNKIFIGRKEISCCRNFKSSALNKNADVRQMVFSSYVFLEKVVFPNIGLLRSKIILCTKSDLGLKSFMKHIPVRAIWTFSFIIRRQATSGDGWLQMSDHFFTRHARSRKISWKRMHKKLSLNNVMFKYYRNCPFLHCQATNENYCFIDLEFIQLI